MKKYILFILPISIIIAVIFSTIIRVLYIQNIWVSQFVNLDVVLLSLYVIWIFLEIKVSKPYTKKESKVSDLFYPLSHGLTVLSAILFTSIWQKPEIFHIIGFIIFITCVLFRLWAIRTLGKYYSHIVRKVEDHKIIDTGPYKFIRHPAYTGMIFAHIGIIFYFFNYFTLLIFLFIFIPSIILRIVTEEKMLYKIEGYNEFAKTRKRIIPLIW